MIFLPTARSTSTTTNRPNDRPIDVCINNKRKNPPREERKRKRSVVVVVVSSLFLYCRRRLLSASIARRGGDPWIQNKDHVRGRRRGDSFVHHGHRQGNENDSPFASCLLVAAFTCKEIRFPFNVCLRQPLKRRRRTITRSPPVRPFPGMPFISIPTGERPAFSSFFFFSQSHCSSSVSRRTFLD